MIDDGWDGYTCTNDTEPAPELTLAAYMEAIRPIKEQHQRLEQEAKEIVKKVFDIDTDGSSAFKFLQALGGAKGFLIDRERAERIATTEINLTFPGRYKS